MRVHVKNVATDKYKAGYADCSREVARYLSTPEPPPLPSVPSLADNGCKTRLLRHLDQCIAEIETEICPRLDPAIPVVASTTDKSTISDKPGYVVWIYHLCAELCVLLSNEIVLCD